MSVTFPGYYDFIATFQNDTDPSLKWRNTWTFYSPTTPVLGAGIVGALALFATTLCHADASVVLFDVYNWSRGRQTYPDGSPIISYPAADGGVADTYWTHLHTPYVPVGSETVLRIDHPSVSPGKPGRNFIRALMGEDDVSAVSGGPPISNVAISDLQADLASALGFSHLNNYFHAGTGGQYLANVRYSKKTTTVLGASEIDGFSVIEVTTNKRTRKNKR